MRTGPEEAASPGAHAVGRGRSRTQTELEHHQMTTFANAAQQPAGSHRRLFGWLGDLVESIRWAVEMQRRCSREFATLDGDAIRRIAAEIEAKRSL
jgi:hypothetical protein